MVGLKEEYYYHHCVVYFFIHSFTMSWLVLFVCIKVLFLRLDKIDETSDNIVSRICARLVS